MVHFKDLLPNRWRYVIVCLFLCYCYCYCYTHLYVYHALLLLILLTSSQILHRKVQEAFEYVCFWRRPKTGLYANTRKSTFKREDWYHEMKDPIGHRGIYGDGYVHAVHDVLPSEFNRRWAGVVHFSYRFALKITAFRT